jgi:hypothetical protein
MDGQRHGVHAGTGSEKGTGGIMPWRKSTRSGANGCVEVNLAAAEVGVRDSKDANSPIITFAPAAWQSFIEQIRSGEYDHPAGDRGL